jgi:hypothetical protein
VLSSLCAHVFCRIVIRAERSYKFPSQHVITGDCDIFRAKRTNRQRTTATLDVGYDHFAQPTTKHPVQIGHKAKSHSATLIRRCSSRYGRQDVCESPVSRPGLPRFGVRYQMGRTNDVRFGLAPCPEEGKRTSWSWTPRGSELQTENPWFVHDRVRWASVLCDNDTTDLFTWQPTPTFV